MKNIITVITLIAFSITSCTKGGKLERISSSQYTISAAASSRQLVPAIDTSFAGTFTGFYDEQANILTFTITWTDLWEAAGQDTITSVNFYGPAGITANGALVRSLPFVSTNSAATANLGLAGLNGFKMSEKQDLLAGGYYFTINTKKYPNGIIRGQLAAIKQ